MFLDTPVPCFNTLRRGTGGSAETPRTDEPIRYERGALEKKSNSTKDTWEWNRWHIPPGKMRMLSSIRRGSIKKAEGKPQRSVHRLSGLGFQRPHCKGTTGRTDLTKAIKSETKGVSVSYVSKNLHFPLILITAVFALAATAARGSDAVLLQTDTVTQGAWPSAYGSNGYMIANGASVNPTYATAGVTGAFNYTWAGLTTDPRALQTAPLVPDRMASAYTQYPSNSFNLNVTTLDGVYEVVALYFLDWDTTTRAQKITITDASTNAVIGAPEAISNFHNGVYMVFRVTGNLVITISPVDTPYGPAPVSPVLSGVFFGLGGPKLVGGNNSGSSAVYSGMDQVTQGSWSGTYGANGYMIANGGSMAPTYATANVAGAFTYTWAGLTSDIRALQTAPGAPTRMASTYTQYQSNGFSINININDGGTHRIALYMLDWDTTSRMQTVTIQDLSTNTTLDVRTFSGFHDGVYALWDIRGNVVITVTPIDYTIPAVSAVFFN